MIEMRMIKVYKSCMRYIVNVCEGSHEMHDYAICVWKVCKRYADAIDA